MGAFQGLLSGQQQGGPLGAAQQTLQQQIETGLPIDTSPAVQNARNFFSDFVLPDINEQLSANFGIKAGTPQGVEAIRAGERLNTQLNTQLLPFAESAAQRRVSGQQQAFGLPAQGAALGGQQQQFDVANLERLLSTLISGTGVLSQGSGFSDPNFQKAGSQQNMENLTSLAAAIGPLIKMFFAA